MRHTIGMFAMSMPYLAAEGGGGGGDAGTGGGAAPGSGTGGGMSGGGAASGAVAEPSVIDVDDNAMIRVKGSDKPVKFGDHVRGFQSQFTKASQEAARLRQQYTQAQQRIQQFEQERQAAQQGGGGQGQQPDIYAELERLPYLDGKSAVQIVKGIGEQLRQRDMVTLAALKKMEQMQRTLQTLNGAHVSSGFESKINGWLKDGGYPEGLQDWAKEVYLAYEPSAQLDAEFPGILKQRFDQLAKGFEAQRQAKVNAARRQPFIPGKGGQAGPNAPIKLSGRESAKDIASQIWESQFGNSTET